MDKTAIISIIENTDLFRNCSPDSISKLSSLTVSAFSSGEMVSGSGRTLGIIVSGKVDIRSSDGGRVLMRSVSAGDVFGAAAVFLDENNISEIIAKTKCEILFVGRETLEEIFASDPAAALSYAEFLSKKVAFLNKKVVSLSSPRADIALAAHIAETSGGKSGFKLNCLAASKKLGIGRTSVYRALKMLEDDGIIRFENGKIYITDEEKLSSRRNLK